MAMDPNYEVTKKLTERLQGTQELKKVILEEGHYAKDSDEFLEKEFINTVVDLKYKDDPITSLEHIIKPELHQSLKREKEVFRVRFQVVNIQPYCIEECCQIFCSKC